VARTIEKLIKIERPREIAELKLTLIEAFSAIPKLDLMDIEPYTKPEIAVHVDLGLDQLEEE
jgi:hypothetical protein